MMKRICITLIPLLLGAILIVSCGRTVYDGFGESVYAPRYASGFEITGAEGAESTIITTHNPWQGADGIETRLFIARGDERPPEGFSGEVLRGEPSRIVCISSTHIAMLDAVGMVERVVGVSGFDYITNRYVAENREKIGDVGYDGNINYELMVALDPDIVFLYGINGTSGMEGKLRELGIPFVYIGDYLEDSPLGKAEWIVAVAEIVGCREKGEVLFAEIPERYNALKRMVAEQGDVKPKVMLNTPYGDSWFMASEKSYVAQLIADAGGMYVYKKNATTRSLPVDMETAAMLVSASDVWLNVGDAGDLAELKRRLPKFADAPSVKSGNVWNCDLRMTAAGGNDYWESGVINPDVVLRDLIKIFHPHLAVEADFVYYRQLK